MAQKVKLRENKAINGLMMKKQFHIIGRDSLIEKMFQRRGWENMANPGPNTLLVFTGGEDVSPELYGEYPHKTTYSNPDRDVDELWDFHKYLHNPKAGICRGGQFLNVASGGAMWQNVDQHALSGTHRLCDLGTGEFISVTSTHHQMMRPSEQAVWLAWARESTIYEGVGEALGNVKENPSKGENIFGDDVNVWDCEVVYYDHTSSLCFQPHPEYGVKSCEDYFFRCLEQVF